MRIREAIDRWNNFRDVYHDVKQVTILSNTSALSNFFADELDVDVRAVDADLINRIAKRNKTQFVGRWPSQKGKLSPMSPATYATRMRLARLLFVWLVDEDIIRKNPFYRVNLKTQAAGPKPWLAPEQIVDIAERTDPTTPWGIRDYAMTLAGFNTGARSGELRRLRLWDFDSDPAHSPLIYVREPEKNSNPRRVVLYPRVAEAVATYLKVARPKLMRAQADDNFLFVSNKGHEVSQTHFGRTIRDTGRAAGIPFLVGPHTLRHSLATHLAKSGMDAFKLQQVMGWKVLNTAANYVHLHGNEKDAEFAEAMQRAFYTPSSTYRGYGDGPMSLIESR